jgi:hypothetical protein
MDEFRIWKVELTVAQIRQMMNQEIQNNGGNVKGAIVPLDVPGLTWANLDGYYQMQPINDVVNGYVLGKATSAIGGKLRNIGTQQPDTAPLPYTSSKMDKTGHRTKPGPTFLFGMLLTA